jgi:hypothetical protein
MEHEPTAPEQDAALEAVFTASGEMEAQAIRSVLEGAGIPAYIKMEAAQRLFAVTVDGLGAVKVMVPADRIEEARSVIENPALPIGDQETSDGQ